MSDWPQESSSRTYPPPGVTALTLAPGVEENPAGTASPDIQAGGINPAIQIDGVELHIDTVAGGLQGALGLDGSNDLEIKVQAGGLNAAIKETGNELYVDKAAGTFADAIGLSGGNEVEVSTRASAPLELNISDEIQVDPVAILGANSPTWNDATQKVDGAAGGGNIKGWKYVAAADLTNSYSGSGANFTSISDLGGDELEIVFDTNGILLSDAIDEGVFMTFPVEDGDDVAVDLRDGGLAVEFEIVPTAAYGNGGWTCSNSTCEPLMHAGICEQDSNTTGQVKMAGLGWDKSAGKIDGSLQNVKNASGQSTTNSNMPDTEDGRCRFVWYPAASQRGFGSIAVAFENLDDVTDNLTFGSGGNVTTVASQPHFVCVFVGNDLAADSETNTWHGKIRYRIIDLETAGY